MWYSHCLQIQCMNRFFACLCKCPDVFPIGEGHVVLSCLCSCRVWPAGGDGELWMAVTDFHSGTAAKTICSMAYCRIKCSLSVCVGGLGRWWYKPLTLRPTALFSRPLGVSTHVEMKIIKTICFGAESCHWTPPMKQPLTGLLAVGSPWPFTEARL